MLRSASWQGYLPHGSVAASACELDLLWIKTSDLNLAHPSLLRALTHTVLVGEALDGERLWNLQGFVGSLLRSQGADTISEHGLGLLGETAP